MKITLFGLFILMLGVQVFGQPVLRQATDTEVTNGTDVRAYVNPRQASGIGGATNGQNAAQVATLIATNSIARTNGVGTGTTRLQSLVVTDTLTLDPGSILANSAGAMIISAGGNLYWNDGSMASSFAGTRFWKNQAVLASSGGFMEDFHSNEWMHASGSVDFTFGTTNVFRGEFSGKGSSLTNLDGANLQTGSVNSNKLDAATRAMLGGGGNVVNGANADITVNSGTIILRADDASVIGTYGRFVQVAVTNSSDTGTLRITSGTNSAGAVFELEGSTNGVSSPVTIKGAGGLIFEGTASFSQMSAATAWLTNVVVPTNSFAGTTVDFSRSDSLTNLGGGLTFTAVANVTAGGANTAIVRLLSGGADWPIAFPASWHTNLNFIGVVTNGSEMDLLFTVLPGIRTNVAQIPYF